MRSLPAFLLIGSLFIVTAAVSSALQDAGAAGFHMEPRATAAGEDSALILWRTSEPVAGIVEYGASEKLGYSVQETSSRQHAVKLEGLKPGTTYHFRVRTSTAESPTALETFATLKAGVGFHVEPYLQSMPTPTGMTIMWETTQAAPSRVEYGPTPQLGLVQEEPKPVKLHQVLWRDCKQAQRTIIACGVTLWCQKSIASAPRRHPAPRNGRWRCTAIRAPIRPCIAGSWTRSPSRTWT